MAPISIDLSRFASPWTSLPMSSLERDFAEGQSTDAESKRFSDSLMVPIQPSSPCVTSRRIHGFTLPGAFRAKIHFRFDIYQT